MLSLATAILLALATVSCDKQAPDNPLTIDWHRLAQTTITTKGDAYDDTVTSFTNVQAKKSSEVEGQSWFIAFSTGKTVYDAFVLSFHFDDIDKLKVGDTLPIRHFLFSFVFSNDSEASTCAYEGSVSLAEKADDHIVLHFQNLRFSCSFGDYLTNGFLYCPLVP